MEAVTTDNLTWKRTKPPVTSTERILKKALESPYESLRKLNDASLYNFLRCFWSEVSQDEFKPNWHIEHVLCPELEKIAHQVGNKQPKEYDLIINVPPGTTKTIVCNVMFPVWCWTKWYWMRFITGGYSSDLALEAAEYSRDIVRSERFKRIYPELAIKQGKEVKSNFRVVKKEWKYSGQAPRLHHGGGRVATSTGARGTGFHGHINIIDDPLNPEQAVSEVELKTANRWVSQTMSTRKTEKKVSVLIIIMQRLHQNDPSGNMLGKKKNIKHICLPGEIRNYRDLVSPPELVKYYRNDLLDPVRMPWKVLEEMEADLGQYGFAGQVGQKPTPPGGGMFKVEHFQVITQLPSPVNFEEVVRYWDKAATEDAGAYTAGVKLARLSNNRFIVMDVKRGQWSTEERERIIRETAEADGVDVEVGVEKEGGSGGKESAEATIRNLAGYNCYAESPVGDKAFRADPFSVQVNNGNVRLLYGAWNKEFVDEFEYFPFGTYKDQVDATSGAFKRLAESRKVVII